MAGDAIERERCHIDGPTCPAVGVDRRMLLGAGLAAAMLPVPAIAATPTRGDAPWSSNYRAPKGSIELALYRKRMRAPGARRDGTPIVLLAHGSSFSAPASFDLQVPGGEYSLMNILARAGYDVWALDFDGYGHSGSTGGNSDIDVSVADLRAAAAFIEKTTGERRLHLYGQSSGALRVGVFAMLEPERAGHVILESFTWTGEGAPTIIQRRKGVAEYRANPRRRHDRESISAIFTRENAHAFEPQVVAAVLAAELPLGSTVPSGTYLDMSTRLPLVDPTKLAGPVMVARGEYDGIATEADLLAFYAKLVNPTRTFLNVGGAAHGVLHSRSRAVLFRALIAFLPPVQA